MEMGPLIDCRLAEYPEWLFSKNDCHNKNYIQEFHRPFQNKCLLFLQTIKNKTRARSYVIRPTSHSQLVADMSSHWSKRQIMPKCPLEIMIFFRPVTCPPTIGVSGMYFIILADFESESFFFFLSYRSDHNMSKRLWTKTRQVGA